MTKAIDFIPNNPYLATYEIWICNANKDANAIDMKFYYLILFGFYMSTFMFGCAIIPMSGNSQNEKSLVQYDLFCDGDHGVANYRIPSIVTTKSGKLLAVCDARISRRGDLPNNIDLMIRSSPDQGVSWSKPKTIVDYPGNEGGGDPAMLVDRTNNVVWLFYVYGTTGVGINTSRQGYHIDSTLQLMAMKSKDEGESWSHPVNITKQIKDKNWYGVFFALGRGIQSRQGRLLVNLMVRKKFGSSQNDHAYVAYSDDYGVTCLCSKSAGKLMGESKVVELEDGSIMINMRSKHKLSQRAVNISQDGGNNWGQYFHDRALIEPTCNASLIRYTSIHDGFQKSRLLFSNPADKGTRRNMAVRISYDEGKTWSDPKVIYSGLAAYSSLTVLKDGTIGLLYERGEQRADEKITFAKFTLEWLTDGKDRLYKKF